MSDKQQLEPALSVITALGGFDKVAEITGKHISRVYRWTYPKERGGTGGFIPQSDANVLLRYARENSIGLSPGQFFGEAA
jgi:hypothetical protein